MTAPVLLYLVKLDLSVLIKCSALIEFSFISILNGLYTYTTVVYSELHRLTKRVWKKPQTQTKPSNLSWRVKYFKLRSLSETFITNPPVAHIRYIITNLHTAWGRGHLLTSLKITHRIMKICEYSFLCSFTKEQQLRDPSERQINNFEYLK